MFLWVIETLQYEKINVSEGIDINKSNKSKESMICHYCNLKKLVINLNHIFVIKCNDISMMTYELENIAILIVEWVGYRYVLSNMTENDAISR